MPQVGSGRGQKASWFSCVTECYLSFMADLYFLDSSFFLTNPHEMFVRSSLLLRKYRILLEARNNVPDMDGRPSLLPVDFNMPDGKEGQVYRQAPMVGL